MNHLGKRSPVPYCLTMHRPQKKSHKYIAFLWIPWPRGSA